MSDEGVPFSVVVRVRRTIVEEVHVSVPVTEELFPDGPPDGAGIFAAAVRLGREQEHAWRREGEPVVEIHPLQTPPPGIGTPRTVV